MVSVRALHVRVLRLPERRSDVAAGGWRDLESELRLRVLTHILGAPTQGAQLLVTPLLESKHPRTLRVIPLHLRLR